MIFFLFFQSETKPPADATDIELQELKKRAQLVSKTHKNNRF